MTRLCRLLAAAAFALTASGPAWSHSKVDLTDPADGAVIEAVPDTLGFAFDKPIRLTRVVQTGPDATAVDLDVSGQGGFATDISVPIVPAGAGSYRIEWRGLSIDGHAMNGALSFEVSAP